MDTTITTLLRESNPPAGQMASPVPQYYDRDKNGPARVEGKHGAPFAVLLGPDGQPINNANRLPVADQGALDKLEQVRQLLDSVDFATQATLAQVLARLEAIEGQLDTGSAKVTLTGQVALLNALSSPGASWKGWGATVGTYAGTHPAPLDVSGYPRRLIHVKNDTDVPLVGVRLNVYGESGESPLESEGLDDVPVGATLVIDNTNSDIIDRPYPYISLRTQASGSTEGTTYVTFFGGV